MQYFKKSITFGLAALISISAAHASILVIGSPNLKVNQLSKQQIDDIYLGKNASASTGEKLQPLDQPSSSVGYQQFYQQLMGWNAGQISSYWTSQVFSGQGNPPVQVNSDAQAITTVAANANAIAYIDSNSLKLQGGRVKVLYGDFNGSGSGTNDYPGVAQQDASQAPAAAVHHADSQQMMAHQQSLLQRRAQPEVMQTTVDQIKFANTHKQNVWNLVRANLRIAVNVNNPQVQHQLLWYLSHRSDLNEFFKNAAPYLGYVVQQAAARNMPAEVALLPMIESDYNPLAYSHAGAAGLWQMMPGTASSYGLDINWWYDSRSDILTSTDAALNYLQRLNSNLGSWDLALAAYNAGQGSIQAAIDYNKRAGHATSFWDLPLPDETRNYVPKLLALAEIIRHPAKYHVKLPYIPMGSYFSSITLNSQLDLPEIARLAEVPVSLVHSLNPGLRRWATSPDANYNLLLPNNKVLAFERNLKRVLGHTHISWQYHEVRDGETLAKIAHNYHTKVALLRQVNGLQNSYVPQNTGILVPLYLNHKYSYPIAFNNQLNDKAFNYKVATNLTANDLLASNQASASSPIAADEQSMPKATTNLINATPENTQSSHVTAAVSSIKKSDSLKSLLTKIYGSD